MSIQHVTQIEVRWARLGSPQKPAGVDADQAVTVHTLRTLPDLLLYASPLKI